MDSPRVFTIYINQVKNKEDLGIRRRESSDLLRPKHTLDKFYRVQQLCCHLPTQNRTFPLALPISPVIP